MQDPILLLFPNHSHSKPLMFRWTPECSKSQPSCIIEMHCHSNQEVISLYMHDFQSCRKLLWRTILRFPKGFYSDEPRQTFQSFVSHQGRCFGNTLTTSHIIYERTKHNFLTPVKVESVQINVESFEYQSWCAKWQIRSWYGHFEGIFWPPCNLIPFLLYLVVRVLAHWRFTQTLWNCVCETAHQQA